ncbi:MAG: Fic family protein [Prevotellaceae bacterium]|jgi:Fic family protein|nr:Fic family protein [Prevotellaceae bacterium]
MASKKEGLEAAKLLVNGEAIGLIEKINGEYLYWDKVKYLTKERQLENKFLWLAAKQVRALSYKKIQLGSYIFRYVVTDEMFELLHELDRNIGDGSDLKNVVPSHQKNSFVVSSIMEEAIASSQLEGASTARKVAKEMLWKNDKPQDVSQQMIANSYHAIGHIKGNAQHDFSTERLKEIHRLMTVGTLDNPDEAGKIRHRNRAAANSGIAVHTPPAHTEVKNLLQDFGMFFNKSNHHFIHPIVKGIIIHFLLAYIQPFSSSNGRTARSLLYWYLIKQGYQMVEYLSVSRLFYKSKRQYEKAFLCAECDENDLTYFILYHLKIMKEALEEMKAYRKRNVAENSSVVALTQAPHLNLRQAQMVKLLTERPAAVLTVKEAETRFAISNQTAKNDLTALVQLGILTEFAINKRKSGYAKSKDFDVKILP